MPRDSQAGVGNPCSSAGRDFSSFGLVFGFFCCHIPQQPFRQAEGSERSSEKLTELVQASPKDLAQFAQFRAECSCLVTRRTALFLSIHLKMDVTKSY